MNLGIYSRQERFNVDTDKLIERDFTKIKVTMNYYQTNSIKIIFDFENEEKMIFDAIEVPYIYGDEVKVSLTGENRQPAYLHKDLHLTLINPITRIKIVFKF